MLFTVYEYNYIQCRYAKAELVYDNESLGNFHAFPELPIQNRERKIKSQGDIAVSGPKIALYHIEWVFFFPSLGE